MADETPTLTGIGETDPMPTLTGIGGVGGAQVPKALIDMTSAEFDAYVDALAESLFTVIGAPQGDIDFDTDSDPIDQLTPAEVRELYQELASDYLDLAPLLVPPDLTPEAEIRASYARTAEEIIAGRLPVRTGVTEVSEHGEIGPMLTRKGQEFTGPSQSGA